MKISVVINNYNYGRFVEECIHSVLRQSHPDFELIIVDDGSTDESWQVISSIKDPRSRAVRKPNGGQLSCFNMATGLISGDVVCFLDADDTFDGNYLERLHAHYLNHRDCDFTFCRVNVFGNHSETIGFGDRVINCGKTRALSYYLRAWIGGPTSSISLTAKTMKAILPKPELEEGWRTRADDVLVWGASLIGVTKYYLPDCIVNYRVHGKEQFLWH